MLEISRKLPGNCVRAKNSQGSRPDTSTHYATQTILIWVLWTCVVGWCPWLSCTEHTTCVSHPGLPRTFPETSRKRPGGPGGGAPGDEDGCTGRIGEGAHEAGRLAAGWAHLARSLTAASAAPIPSGLEFETRDGSYSGAVATGRQGLDGAGTGWLCSLLQDFCHGLLLLALAQGSIPAHIPLPARPLAHRLAVTQPARDRIWTRPRVGRKCPLQATCSADSEALPCVLHCACLNYTCQGHATQFEPLQTCRGRSIPRLQSAPDGTEPRIQSQCLQRLPSNKECFREAELLQCSCHTPKQAVCTAVVHPRADWQMQAPSRSDLGEIPARRWGQSTQEGQSLPCSLLAAEVLHGPCAR
jgi:hypothetical protein